MKVFNHFKFLYEFPTRLQLDSKDCGSACLVSLLEHHNVIFPLNDIKNYVQIQKDGSTLLDLKNGIQNIGGGVETHYLSIDQLSSLNEPCIVH